MHKNKTKWAKRKQTLVFDDLFLQDGSFTLFGFQVRAHLRVLIVGHAPPSILILWKEESQTLFGLLGASSRKIST